MNNSGMASPHMQMPYNSPVLKNQVPEGVYGSPNGMADVEIRNSPLRYPVLSGQLVSAAPWLGLFRRRFY